MEGNLKVSSEQQKRVSRVNWDLLPKAVTILSVSDNTDLVTILDSNGTSGTYLSLYCLLATAQYFFHLPIPSPTVLSKSMWVPEVRQCTVP